MLIDTGNHGDSTIIINYIKKQSIKRLDYIIGTHPHEDHIGSMDSIINTFDIGSALMPTKLSRHEKTALMHMKKYI